MVISRCTTIALVQMCSATDRDWSADCWSFGLVSAMKHRALIVTSEENIWWVRLDGVEVVSFFGPHAQQWAFRERVELAELLEAQSDAELDEQHHESMAQPLFSKTRGTKAAQSLASGSGSTAK